MPNRMGPQASGKARQNTHELQLPAELAAVALVDAKRSAAPGCVSLTWWYDKVASGDAPQPVVRGPRCTRWRLADVAKFWADFAASGKSGEDMRANARRASACASSKRALHVARVGG